MFDEEKNKLEKILDDNLNGFASEDEFEDAINILAQMLLTDPKWKQALKVTKYTKKIRGLQDLPMICKGSDCPYVLKCPIAKKLKTKVAIDGLIGTECRAEQIYAVEQFASLVRDLRIDPTQSTDIVDVCRLIRLLVIQRRTTWDLAVNGITSKVVAGIHQPTGNVYMKDEENPVMKSSADLEKQIQALQKTLMASREQRFTQLKGVSSVEDIFQKMLQGEGKEEFKQLVETNEAIDAEFSED